MRWVEVYNLRDDATHIRHVQEATLNTKEYGFLPEHGLFGSTQWWKAVEEGVLPTVILKGQVSKVILGGMGDMYEIEVAEHGGAKTRWLPWGDIGQYEQNRSIRISYVLQKWRTKRNVDILGEFSQVPLIVELGLPDMKENAQ